MQTLVTFPVVLAGKCFSTYGAHERTFVGMGTQVRSQVIGSGKSLWTERALESGRVFLNALGISAFGD